MFEVTLLQDLSHAEDSPYHLADCPVHPPILGTLGEYFGHEWSRWRYDTLDERIDVILEAFRETGAGILDVGCASGVKAAHFARHGHRVTAIDILDRSREIAARNLDGRHPIAFIRADLRELSADAWRRRFDVIHARRVLNFMTIDAVHDFIGEAKAMLSEEGFLCASFIADQVTDATEMTRCSARGSTPPLQLCPGMYAHHFTEVHFALRGQGFGIVEGFSDMKVEAGFIARLSRGRVSAKLPE